jgi:hypothetical protein
MGNTLGLGNEVYPNPRNQTTQMDTRDSFLPPPYTPLVESVPTVPILNPNECVCDKYNGDLNSMQRELGLLQNPSKRGIPPIDFIKIKQLKQCTQHLVSFSKAIDIIISSMRKGNDSVYVEITKTNLNMFKNKLNSQIPGYIFKYQEIFNEFKDLLVSWKVDNSYSFENIGTSSITKLPTTFPEKH